MASLLACVLLFIITACSPALCGYCNSPCATSWIDCGLSSECYDTCSSQSCSNDPDPCVNCILSSSVCDATVHNLNCLMTAYWGDTCNCVAFWASCHTSSDHELDKGGICSLSGGGIAVIVVLSVLAVLVLAAVTFCCCYRKRSRKTSEFSETSTLINAQTQ